MAKYDNIFEEVLRIPISEVFIKFGFQIKRCGASWQLPSPFRKDSSPTSFTLDDKKNMFRDWVATEYTGNSISFIQKYYNLQYFEACMEIAVKFGIITEGAYRKILSRRPNSSEIKYYETVYKTVEKVQHVPASPEVLDKVYRIFIDFTSLHSNHLEHLKNERFLSEETINEHMFFSFPTRGILRKFLKTIENNFGSQDVLKDIPGFFKRKDEKNFTFNTSKGIGIPIFNEIGQIIGIQIRLDELNKSGLRYCWFSSAFADNDETSESDTIFGTSSGSPIDVVYPKELKFKGVFITEGKFKALKLAEAFNCVCLSLQGVSTWAPIINTLNKLPNVVNSTYPQFHNEWKIQMVYSAFDADMSKNLNVYKQLLKMTDKILTDVTPEVRGDKFGVRYLYWDVDFAKGVDDLINACSSIEEVRTRLMICNKENFDKSYEKLIEKVLELNPEITNESSISSMINADDFKDYFDKYFDLP